MPIGVLSSYYLYAINRCRFFVYLLATMQKNAYLYRQFGQCQKTCYQKQVTDLSIVLL